MSKTDYPFDFFFAKACAEREHQKELGAELHDDDSNSDAEDDGDEEEDDAEEGDDDDDAEKGPEENVADAKSS